MCGIFGVVADRQDKNAQSIVLQGIKDLEYRGYDSWGIAVKTGQNSWWTHKKVGKIGHATSNAMPTSHFAFGHTRWATHGGVTDNNAHPHLDCQQRYALIHNGIVENFDQLKQDLMIQGHQFNSQTDSEVIVHLIEEFSKHLPFEQAVIKVFSLLKGASAIIVADSHAEKLIAIKNGSPLVIGFDNAKNMIASDASALIAHTNQVYFMQDFDYACLTKDGVDIKNIQKPIRRSIKPQTLPWSSQAATKGDYDHFMLKEINEQPEMLERIFYHHNYQSELIQTLQQANKIHCLGCGTAHHAAMIAKYVLSPVLEGHVDNVVSSEYQHNAHNSDAHTVTIAFSQSGETMDTIIALRDAQKHHAKIVAAVNALGSSIDRMADFTIALDAGPEKAVASTKAFLAKVAHLWMIRKSFDPNYRSQPRRVIKAIENTVSASFQVNLIKIAKKIIDQPNLFVIGRGISYPVALETALKIKEISYIHAEGLAAGELKHGVIALIEPKTPCIVLAPNDNQYDENISSAMELKARGGHIIGVSPVENAVFDDWIKTTDIGESTIFQNIVIGQLVAYHLSILRGLDPDMPRNLAKSVTVK